MVGDTGKDIGQPGLRIDAVELGCLIQRIGNGRRLAADRLRRPSSTGAQPGNRPCTAICRAWQLGSLLGLLDIAELPGFVERRSDFIGGGDRAQRLQSMVQPRMEIDAIQRILFQSAIMGWIEQRVGFALITIGGRTIYSVT